MDPFFLIVVALMLGGVLILIWRSFRSRPAAATTPDADIVNQFQLRQRTFLVWLAVVISMFGIFALALGLRKSEVETVLGLPIDVYLFLAFVGASVAIVMMLRVYRCPRCEEMVTRWRYGRFDLTAEICRSCGARLKE